MSLSFQQKISVMDVSTLKLKLALSRRGLVVESLTREGEFVARMGLISNPENVIGVRIDFTFYRKERKLFAKANLQSVWDDYGAVWSDFCLSLCSAYRDAVGYDFTYHNDKERKGLDDIPAEKILKMVDDTTVFMKNFEKNMNWNKKPKCLSPDKKVFYEHFFSTNFPKTPFAV